jgi:hypothetical protein
MSEHDDTGNLGQKRLNKQQMLITKLASQTHTKYMVLKAIGLAI